MLICWVDLTRPGLRLLGTRFLGVPVGGGKEEATEMETLFSEPSVFDLTWKILGQY